MIFRICAQGWFEITFILHSMFIHVLIFNGYIDIMLLLSDKKTDRVFIFAVTLAKQSKFFELIKLGKS